MLWPKRVVACAVAAAVVTGPALAQPRKPTDKETSEASELVKQAITNSQGGDHEGAVILYLRAYKIVPLPILLSNVGSEYLQWSKPVEALRYFCMYLREDPTGPNVTYATSRAKILRLQLGGRVDDDKQVCDRPATEGAITAPGSTAPTRADATRSARADSTKPARAKPDPNAGVTGTVGFSRRAPPEPSDRGGGLKVTGVIVTGLGVAGLGLGIYFGLRAQAISDEISTNTAMWRDDIRSYEAEGQRDEYLQIGGLIGGGALIATGTILYLIGRSQGTSSSEQVTVAPMANARGGGIVWSRDF